MSKQSDFLPLAKIFDSVIRKPSPGSETIDVIVYRRPDYKDLDRNNNTIFFDDLYATVGPTAKFMKGGAGDSSQ
jgi:hypothetical protein